MNKPSTLAEWVHWWYEEIGANIIPANSRIKKTWIAWSQYQNAPIPKEQIESWLATGAFNQGVAVMAGKLWRGRSEGKYLIFIDCDGQKAIEAFCSTISNTKLADFAARTLVEQHLDNPSKAHIYLVSEVPIPNKPSNVLGLEIKSEGNHGIAYCTPSVHKDGHRYEIVGTLEPLALSEHATLQLKERLIQVYRGHSLEYATPRLPYIGGQVIDEPQYTDKLTPEKLERMAEFLSKKYIKGQVHDLTWATAGTLRRQGVPLSDAIALIRRTGELAGDSPRGIESHIAEVEGTYRRDISRPLRGKTSLRRLVETA